MPDIDGEPAYPIYSVAFKFHHSITDPERVKDYPPRWFEGIPAGRMWSGSSMNWMRKEERSEAEIIAALSDHNLTRFREKLPDLDGWEVSVTGPKFETWCLGWFNHHTIDRDQDDIAVLASFERYVNRTQQAIERGEPLSLMCAKERWRWRGAKEGDPAPCRCDGCKKCGFIRINH